jgi:hypothetical protein
MLCSIYNYFFGKKTIDELQITKNNIEINNIETINDIEIKNYNKITDIYCVVYMSKKNVICINKTNIKDMILFNSTNKNILYIIEYVNIKCNIPNLIKYNIKNL